MRTLVAQAGPLTGTVNQTVSTTATNGNQNLAASAHGASRLGRRGRRGGAQTTVRGARHERLQGPGSGRTR
jgi:hypothetical protein